MIETLESVDWLRQKRRSALARFGELGFPKISDEEWRFTDVSSLAQTTFAAASEDIRGLTPAGLPGLPGLGAGPQLVFINGRYAPQLSTENEYGTSLAAWLKSGAKNASLRLARDDRPAAFCALNTAYFADGAAVILPKGARPEMPIRLLFISLPSAQPTVAYPRILIEAGAGSHAVIIEEYAGLEGGVRLNNVAVEIELGENAGLEHYKIQRESAATFHVAATEVRQGRNSRYISHSVSLGGGLVRNDLSVLLEGEGSNCILNGLYVVCGSQHVDNHTKIDHSKPHTTSRELYKGVLNGHSRAVFNGSIIVRPDAQKISSVQSNKNLLLSEHGLVNTKPEFKIYANDVQCKHGATIGQLSSEALFYLRSRGIAPQEARQMLVYAFISEMVELMGLESLKQAVRKYV